MEFDFVLLIKFCLYTFLYELLKFTFFTINLSGM